MDVYKTSTENMYLVSHVDLHSGRQRVYIHLNTFNATNTPSVFLRISITTPRTRQACLKFSVYSRGGITMNFKKINVAVNMLK